MTDTIGCLVIHGFAGDIRDVLPLAKALREEGYHVECPTLEGHGLGRRHLGRSTRHDWLRSAEEAYKRLSMRSDRIVVIGFSMGGLLAFHIASRYPVSLLVTLNTPYYYWDLRQAINYLQEDFAVHSRRYLRSMVKIPVRSMLQFRRLLAETKPVLAQVSCPYVLLQAKRDDTVRSISAEQLAKSVKSLSPRIAYYDRSGHMLLHGPERDDVIAYVLDTIREHCTAD
ncbi:alpha/beta hydrolase [Brevibacillus sp. H7]|uniref:alpha/beta hydrolase n=1 Tax=Brevibacillus sp. H7 TaxID=3349138 RepID=UPI00380617B1